MLFNSYIFILLFWPVSVIIYFLLNKVCKSNKQSLLILSVLSFVFYGYYNWYYLLILWGSITVNWSVSQIMKKQSGKMRKIIAAVGVLFDIGLIFYFKYFNFFIENINTFFQTNFNLRNIVLPLGISFFTFQQISYVIDSYRGETEDYTLIEYISFISFFPQLIAGPIVYHDELIPQFRKEENRVVNWANMSRGLYLFAIGLVKKVIIADTFGKAVDWGHQNLSALSSMDAMVIILSYTMQIYFDFSGYCDMASGIASMFNFTLPINFDSPYKSISIVEFWQRWHMTLTRFLRKYIYFPLGGNRKGTVRTYFNVMIVFLVSGIWHGANWTFILWGILHGIASCLNRLWKNKYEKLNKVWQWFLTFSFVNFAWTIFRADTIKDAFHVIWRSINFRDLTISSDLANCFVTTEVSFIKHIVQKVDVFAKILDRFSINGFVMWAWILGAFYIVINKENAQRRQISYSVKMSIMTALLLVWGIISLSGVSTFLYFNF